MRALMDPAVRATLPATRAAATWRAVARPYDDEVDAPRWLELEGVVNMRDLGGLPTTDGATIRPGRLIRSDNLQDLSPAAVETLVSEVGVSDIVDLRSDTELHEEGPGPLLRVTDLTHHHHSLLPEEGRRATVEEALAMPWASIDDAGQRDVSYWAGHYLGYLTDRPDSVSAALRVIAASSGATVVHCAAGKDRTGTVVGMALDVAGVRREDILADYALSAERIEQIMARLAARPLYGPALLGQPLSDQTPRPETMAAILDALDQGFGGAAGWLRARGWTGDDVERLRHKLRD
jgi:protein tyrosine/serine phosphatase